MGNHTGNQRGNPNCADRVKFQNVAKTGGPRMWQLSRGALVLTHNPLGSYLKKLKHFPWLEHHFSFPFSYLSFSHCALFFTHSCWGETQNEQLESKTPSPGNSPRDHPSLCFLRVFGRVSWMMSWIKRGEASPPSAGGDLGAGCLQGTENACRGPSGRLGYATRR